MTLLFKNMLCNSLKIEYNRALKFSFKEFMCRQTLMLALIFSTLTLLSGCIYRQTILQGNIVSEQTREQLKPGMSKSQIIALLGKPVLDNAFEENTWYYLYTQQKGNEKMLKKRLVLYFSGDRLHQVETE